MGGRKGSNALTMVYVVRYLDTDGPHDLIYLDPTAAEEAHAEFTDWGLSPRRVSRERFMHRRHNPEANRAAEWIDAQCPLPS